MPEVTGSSPVSSTIQNAGSLTPVSSFRGVGARDDETRAADPDCLARALGGECRRAAPISARDALTSLKTLHAALATGLDCEGYHRQLIDTKNTFDRYAEAKVTTVPEASAKAAMSAAMTYHRFALPLWATALRRDGLCRCPRSRSSPSSESISRVLRSRSWSTR